MASPPGKSWAVKLTAFFLKCSGFWPFESKLGQLTMDALVVYTISAVLGAIGFTTVDVCKCVNDIEVFSTWPCCYTYFCFDNFLCQMNITATGQFVILQKQLREICDGHNGSTSLDECRLHFVRCIRRHQQLIAFVEDIKELYRSVMLGVVILLSFLICMEMFQLMTSSSSSALSTFHYCVYVGGSITQLYFYTMTCDNLTGASLAISDAAYDVRWFSMASSSSQNQFVKDLSMVIMRSQRACTLTVGGFAPVTLQTFTSICHTAFSFLALIRQTLEKNEQ